MPVGLLAGVGHPVLAHGGEPAAVGEVAQSPLQRLHAVVDERPAAPAGRSSCPSANTCVIRQVTHSSTGWSSSGRPRLSSHAKPPAGWRAARLNSSSRSGLTLQPAPVGGIRQPGHGLLLGRARRSSGLIGWPEPRSRAARGPSAPRWCWCWSRPRGSPLRRRTGRRCRYRRQETSWLVHSRTAGARNACGSTSALAAHAERGGLAGQQRDQGVVDDRVGVHLVGEHGDVALQRAGGHVHGVAVVGPLGPRLQGRGQARSLSSAKNHSARVPAPSTTSTSRGGVRRRCASGGRQRRASPSSGAPTSSVSDSLARTAPSRAVRVAARLPVHGWSESLTATTARARPRRLDRQQPVGVGVRAARTRAACAARRRRWPPRT